MAWSESGSQERANAVYHVLSMLTSGGCRLPMTGSSGLIGHRPHLPQAKEHAPCPTVGSHITPATSERHLLPWWSGHLRRAYGLLTCQTRRTIPEIGSHMRQITSADAKLLVELRSWDHSIRLSLSWGWHDIKRQVPAKTTT